MYLLRVNPDHLPAAWSCRSGTFVVTRSCVSLRRSTNIGLLGFPLVGSSCWCWALLSTLSTCQLPWVVFAQGGYLGAPSRADNSRRAVVLDTSVTSYPPGTTYPFARHKRSHIHILWCKSLTKDHLPRKTAFSGPKGWPFSHRLHRTCISFRSTLTTSRRPGAAVQAPSWRPDPVSG